MATVFKSRVEVTSCWPGSYVPINAVDYAINMYHNHERSSGCFFLLITKPFAIK